MNAQDILLDSDPTGKYLVWDLTANSRVISYQMEVLIRNRPIYLLPCFLRFRQGKQQICQDISGLISLDMANPEQDLRPERGREILFELINDLFDAADHLLPVNQMILTPSTIFLDVNHKLVLTFWPVCRRGKIGDIESGGPQELQEIFQTLGKAFHLPDAETDAWCDQLAIGGLPQIQKWLDSQYSNQDEHTKLPVSSEAPKNGARTRVCSYAHICAARITRILSKPMCLGFLHVICLGGYLAGIRIGKSWSITVKVAYLLSLLILLLIDVWQVRAMHLKQNHHDAQCPGNSQIIKGTTAAMEKHGLPDIICAFFKRIIIQLTGYISEMLKSLRQGLNPAPDLTPDPGGQTVFHSTNPDDFRMALLSEGKPGTLDENEGIRAYILVDEFIIGRDQKNCDLYLENLEIGRQHARILRREGSFFLCDLGSRNGSSVDGRRIMKNTETLLPDQCLIKFADRQFYFQAD